MNKYTLNFKGHFDAAHRLESYTGKCSNLHGHRWDIEITLYTDSLQNEMVLDFNVLKDILDEFDHSTILKQCEENQDLINLINQKGWKLILLLKSPTAENISKEIYERIYNITVSDLKVKVFESPNASIEYENY